MGPFPNGLNNLQVVVTNHLVNGMILQPFPIQEVMEKSESLELRRDVSWGSRRRYVGKKKRRFDGLGVGSTKRP